MFHLRDALRMENFHLHKRQVKSLLIDRNNGYAIIIDMQLSWGSWGLEPQAEIKYFKKI